MSDQCLDVFLDEDWRHYGEEHDNEQTQDETATFDIRSVLNANVMNVDLEVVVSNVEEGKC